MNRALLRVLLSILLGAWMMVTTNAYAAPTPEGAIVPGAPPSREHRWGTVMIYGREVKSRATLDQAIVGVEWDAFMKRVVRRFEIDRMPFQTGSVQAARNGDDTFVVFGT